MAIFSSMRNTLFALFLLGLISRQTQAKDTHWLFDAGVSYSQSGLYDDENSGFGVNSSFAYTPDSHWALGLALLHFKLSNLVGRASAYSTAPLAVFGNYHFTEINKGAFLGPLFGAVIEERIDSRDGPNYLALRPGIGLQGGYNFKIHRALSIGPSGHLMMVFGKAASYTLWTLACKASLKF